MQSNWRCSHQNGVKYFYHFLTAQSLHCIVKWLRRDVKHLHHMSEIILQNKEFFSQRIKDFKTNLIREPVIARKVVRRQ